MPREGKLSILLRGQEGREAGGEGNDCLRSANPLKYALRDTEQRYDSKMAREDGSR